MKLGEIKAQAMLLMFPDVNLVSAKEKWEDTSYGATSYDSAGISESDLENESSELLLALSSDSNYLPYVNGMAGAINRCFSYLESHFLIPCKKAELTDGRAMGSKISFELPDDVFCVGRVAFLGDGVYVGNVGFEHIGAKTVVLPKMRFDGTYTVIYTPYLERIKCTTSDFYEIPLPEPVASMIPYFIKGDLFVNDDADEAMEARNIFENCVSVFANCGKEYSDSVEETYSMGSLQ